MTRIVLLAAVLTQTWIPGSQVVSVNDNGTVTVSGPNVMTTCHHCEGMSACYTNWMWTGILVGPCLPVPEGLR